MKIDYRFADGTVSEIEVSEEVGTFIIDSYRREHNSNCKEHFHCYSLDAVEYEGADFAAEDDYGELTDEQLRVRKALSRLTETQRRRLQMVSDGLTYREIALIEGVDFKTVCESVTSARKKFLKFYR